MASKFTNLNNYFLNLETEEITLTFNEIEAIIGQKLCHSAYRYPAYWHDSKTHMLPKCWVQNGYKMENLDLKIKKVRFKRINPTNTSGNNANIAKGRVSNISKYEGRKRLYVSADKVLKGINKYFNDLISDKNSRYLSWEHCYRAFQNARNKEHLNIVDIEYLSLHLAFYLASWGMLRGSSFLLQKDYRVHIDAIEELYKPAYINLWAIDYKELYDQYNIDSLMILINNLKNIYDDKRKNVKDVSTDISDILITKVLLGTMACVPAYDGFFKRGVRQYNITTQRLSKSSILGLIDYYDEHEIELELIRDKISSIQGINYPQMKILDMAFWQLGFDHR